MPHEVAILPVPTGASAETTTEALITWFDGGDLTAIGPEWEEWTPIEAGGVGVTSPGQTVWVALDLVPGTYAAVCFFPGGTGQPHILDGMVRVFPVGATPATPAAAGERPGPDLSHHALN
jgi:hypothetical protein